jgi:hypothetical protein
MLGLDMSFGLRGDYCESAPFANYYPILGAMYKQFVKLIHGKFVGRRFIVRLNGWVVYPFHICCQTFLRANTLAAAPPYGVCGSFAELHFSHIAIFDIGITTPYTQSV